MRSLIHIFFFAVCIAGFGYGKAVHAETIPQKDSNVVEARYTSSDGRVLTALYNLQEQKVVIRLPEGKELSLPLAVSGSGARYSNGKETFWEHKSVGRFLIDDKVIFEGRLADDQP